MSSLPPPSPDQAFCHVSALESGFIDLPLHLVLSTADPSLNQKIIAPSLSFLIRHSKHTDKNFLFDLGIRKDWESYPPSVVQRINTIYKDSIWIPNDVCDSLAKGGLSPTDIDTVCVSHLYWDHVSTAAPFTNSTFILGADSKDLLESQSQSTNSGKTNAFAHDIPLSRIRFLPSPKDESQLYIPIGPFLGFDYFNDGSLYIVDAPGRARGHINVLVRTSPDGGWIYLAGDSAHHWGLVTGDSDIACHDGFGCVHEDKEKAKEHIGKIRELMEVPRVKVLLAHDERWYNEHKGSEAFWPGVIQSA
ncbi:Metallo-hydrolase/oxidoreductase [Dendrothele bispora CBS 962.96]|uniref:Metallo-hydrolase/oxidoreductase n=1 Tax=Dendrothele bispora (strain CBS 962.96) TaxID=1314807 RepID=A0A4S8MQG4_DENBC|nr:Metallo-hydrolase/oxidoreductase [Dendrothele bispora CBS 962.96]